MDRAIDVNIVGIVGCRKFKNYELFKKKVQEWEKLNGKITMIVSGGATGADSLAERYAIEHNIGISIYKPDWIKFGKAAGIMRNTDIVNSSNRLIAFPSKSSVGTWDSINKAKKAGKDVMLYNV